MEMELESDRSSKNGTLRLQTHWAGPPADALRTLALSPPQPSKTSVPEKPELSPSMCSQRSFAAMTSVPDPESAFAIVAFCPLPPRAVVFHTVPVQPAGTSIAGSRTLLLL